MLACKIIRAWRLKGIFSESIYVFVLTYFNPLKKIDPRKIFLPTQNILDPHNPRKNHYPPKILTHVKNISTHLTHATHVKI